MIATKTSYQDAKYVAENMRKRDREELSKLGKTPFEAVNEGLASAECFTLAVDETPIMIFGMEPAGIDSAIIWALGTDDVFKYRKEFLKQSIKWRDSYLSDYSRLFNHVDVDNKESIRWLKWLGATFDEPKPFGNGKFMRFEFNV